MSVPPGVMQALVDVAQHADRVTDATQVIIARVGAGSFPHGLAVELESLAVAVRQLSVALGCVAKRAYETSTERGDRIDRELRAIPADVLRRLAGE